MQPPVERNDRRATWQGFGDGLSQAVEMAVTPVLFALLGLFLDRRLDTVPFFAVGFSIFAMVGTFVRAYCVYRHQSDADISGIPRSACSIPSPGATGARRSAMGRRPGPSGSEMSEHREEERRPWARPPR